MMLLWLLGCIPNEAYSRNPKVQADALETLAAWQARQIVPELEEWATHNPEERRLRRAAMNALLRADTDEGEEAIRRQLEGPWRHEALLAVDSISTKRSCDLAVELLLETTDPQERDLLTSHLKSTHLNNGWQCFQSLRPYRDQPTLARLWSDAYASQ